MRGKNKIISRFAAAALVLATGLALARGGPAAQPAVTGGVVIPHMKLSGGEPVAADDPGAAGVTIAEPATLAVIGLGLVGLGIMRRGRTPRN